MPKRLRINGLPEGSIDTKTREIRFTLALSENRQTSFVARYGVAAQVVAGLARMVKQLHEILLAERGIETAAAEPVGGAHVQKDRWSARTFASGARGFLRLPNCRRPLKC